jgi:CheY-like chemotaxis protein
MAQDIQNDHQVQTKYCENARICIVDDNEEVLGNIKESLEDYGFTNVIATTYQDYPIKMAIDGKLDAIIMDRKMPSSYLDSNGSESMGTGTILLEYIVERSKSDITLIKILYSDFQIPKQSFEYGILEKNDIEFLEKSSGHSDLIELICEKLINCGFCRFAKTTILKENRMDLEIKANGFDIATAPLLRWLEAPKHANGRIFIGSKAYSYGQMALAIRNGDAAGVNYALEFLEMEREEFAKSNNLSNNLNIE